MRPPSGRETIDARLARGARRLTLGSLEGRSEQAQPLPARARALAFTPGPPYLPFTYGSSTSPVSVSESGNYEIRNGGPLGVWIAKLTTAGSTTTTVVVKKNGSTVGTFTLTSGITRKMLDLTAVHGSGGDDINVAVTAGGTGAKGLVVLAPIS